MLTRVDRRSENVVVQSVVISHGFAAAIPWHIRIAGSFVPHELVLQREREPGVDFDTVTFTEFLELIEQAKRRQSIRRGVGYR